MVKAIARLVCKRLAQTERAAEASEQEAMVRAKEGL